MKVFWAPKTRSTRALWMLEELGVEYELERIELGAAEESRSDAFRAASPMGKVPALEDGDARMAESAAICLYLADRYSAGRLAPALDSADRGHYLYWMLYTPAVVEPAMSEKFNKVEANRLRSGWGDFDLMIDTWEREIADKDWILGKNFSAADVMLGSSAVFLRMFDMLPDAPAINAYADRCLARDAYKKALQINES